RGLVLDDEALHLIVCDVARPDDRHVAPRGVADPLLLAVEHPGVALALRSRREATARPGADQRLGQAEAADLFEARHRGEPLLLLLLRSTEVDGAHREAVVHAEERRERRIDARHLHLSEPEESDAATPAAVALHSQATDAELAELRQQLEGERILGPVLRDHG